MWKNTDKVRAHREELKRLWFSLPHEENKKDMKVITITKHPTQDWWVLKCICDTADSYTSFSSGFRSLEEVQGRLNKLQTESKTKYNLDTEQGKRLAKSNDYHNYQVIYK